jgi:hypothetical protein
VSATIQLRRARARLPLRACRRARNLSKHHHKRHAASPSLGNSHHRKCRYKKPTIVSAASTTHLRIGGAADFYREPATFANSARATMMSCEIGGRARVRRLPSIPVCDVLCARHLVAHGHRAPASLASVSSNRHDCLFDRYAVALAAGPKDLIALASSF